MIGNKIIGMHRSNFSSPETNCNIQIQSSGQYRVLMPEHVFQNVKSVQPSLLEMNFIYNYFATANTC